MRNVDTEDLHIKQGIDQSSKVLLFAGQYGDGYAALFESFISQAHQVVQKYDPVNIVISPHPRTDGSLENAQIEAIGHDRIRMAIGGLSTSATYSYFVRSVAHS